MSKYKSDDEQRKIEILYGDRLKQKRELKCGDELKKRAIKKYEEFITKGNKIK